MRYFQNSCSLFIFQKHNFSKLVFTSIYDCRSKTYTYLFIYLSDRKFEDKDHFFYIMIYIQMHNVDNEQYRCLLQLHLPNLTRHLEQSMYSSVMIYTKIFIITISLVFQFICILVAQLTDIKYTYKIHIVIIYYRLQCMFLGSFYARYLLFFF